MKKLAVVGASYLQRPLVLKAKEMGMEVYAFAWEEGSVVQDVVDAFFPISIVEKEAILDQCKKICIDGITSIASDLAMETVNYVATEMGLVGNPMDVTRKSTHKWAMRMALTEAGLPCPKFQLFSKPLYTKDIKLEFPLIVKPVDRSGSRGVTKVETMEGVNPAIEKALVESLCKEVIVEEFVTGQEYSVEMISWKGQHTFLAITEKKTTGSPHFVELSHHQPATLDPEIVYRIIEVVKNCLSVLGIQHGASHSELIVNEHGEIRIVEIAGRMGGDFIGSHMVQLSTGFDFLRGVVEIALGTFNGHCEKQWSSYSDVFYITPDQPGIIEAIEDRSGYFPQIQEAVFVKNVGDVIDLPLDSSAKRAVAIITQRTESVVGFEPTEVIDFRMKKEQVVPAS